MGEGSRSCDYRRQLQLPRQPGVYALVLELPRPRRMRVGSLGDLSFPSGIYVYLGSAFGPGGVGSRLGRHLRGGEKYRWHIDYLRSSALVIGYCLGTPAQGKDFPFKLECQWTQTLASLPEARIPAQNFGASDCAAGCAAHLIALPTGFDINKLPLLLTEGTRAPLEQVIYRYGELKISEVGQFRR